MRVDSLPLGGTQSWWFQDAHAQDTHRPESLNSDDSVDVAIVGGGYTGLWTALALSDRSSGVRTAVLEGGLCGSQASGKNGGVVHGYWTYLHRLLPMFGVTGTRQVAEMGSRAQQAVEDFCCSQADALWWRSRGMMKIATTMKQGASLQNLVDAARAIERPEKVTALSLEQVQARCASPRFRSGAFLPEAATVHPAKLALALRNEALHRGISVFENTPLSEIKPVGDSYLLRVPNATLKARRVVLTTNSALVRLPPVRPHMTNFSSFAVMTEPLPNILEEIGWTGGESIADSRMFLHYFRTTPDGRVLMGTGSGPIAFGSKMKGLSDDRDSIGRAVDGLRSLLPALSEAKIVGAWGGPIDVSADHLPFFGTIKDTRIQYGCGYSGHGVNAAWIGGQVLSALALGEKNEWTTSPFHNRKLPSLPPEPFRYLGGRSIRAAILSCEEAEERGRAGNAVQRVVASLPKVLGIQVGTR